MLDYLRIACKSNQLYKAMESEYKRKNSPGFFKAEFTTLEEHVRDYTHGILSIILADEPMAIHLSFWSASVREGMRSRTEICGSKEGEQHQLPHAYPSRHVARTISTSVLDEDSAQEQHRRISSRALFKEACKNEEENINVLFNTLNDAMKELAEE